MYDRISEGIKIEIIFFLGPSVRKNKDSTELDTNRNMQMSFWEARRVPKSRTDRSPGSLDLARFTIIQGPLGQLRMRQLRFDESVTDGQTLLIRIGMRRRIQK